MQVQEKFEHWPNKRESDCATDAEFQDLLRLRRRVCADKKKVREEANKAALIQANASLTQQNALLTQRLASKDQQLDQLRTMYEQLRMKLTSTGQAN